MPAGKVVKVYAPKSKGLNKREKQQVKRLINMDREKKLIVTNVTGSISSIMAFNNVSSVNQGDGDLERIGDSITIKSIHWTGQVIGADSTNYVRLVMFQWHADDNADPPDVSALTQVASGTEGLVAGVFRKDTKPLYTILYDKKISTDTYNNAKQFTKNIYKGFRKRIKYLAGGNSGMQKIYTAVVSDSGAVSHPAITSQVCIYFTDA